LVPNYARPTPSSSHNGHDYFDSDNTLSTSMGYDFTNEVSFPKALVNFPLISEQASITTYRDIIMPNTIQALKNVLLISQGVINPHMHTLQGHEDSPRASGHPFTFIGITISLFFEILDQGSYIVND